jgi:DNA modification methylase
VKVIQSSADDAISTLIYDHIISDPPYDAQPDVDFLRKHCSGNIILFCDPLKRPNAQPDEILYWIKSPSTKNTTKRCSRFVEEIMVYRGKNAPFNNDLHWSVYTGVFTDTLIAPNGHPWQKPISLMEKLIRIYSNPGETVLDPYAGSGATLKAAEICGRMALGCDIDEQWTTQ